MGRQKVALLRSALKRGVGGTVAQATRSLRDALWDKRQFVYLIDLADNRPPASPPPPRLAFRRIEAWSELPPESRRRLEAEKGNISWGDFHWLDDLGYGLWVGEIDGRLAVTKWWRHQPQAQDFFVPAPEGTELHWQTAVMPEFRGQRLLDHVIYTVMAYRAECGVSAFIASCRDYNTTSRRFFARAGWTWLGHGSTPKWGGAPHFRPARPPRLAGELEGIEADHPARLASGAMEVAEAGARAAGRK